ncbi:MAG: ThuA domain-containing protein [Planctomycetes bacterium]|nr:ThuA domain-containing protein [Planctomycetota bacterium]
MLRIVFSTFAIVTAGLVNVAQAGEPARLPPGVVVEETCPDAKLTKIVFVAGSSFYKPGEHEYLGGAAVLMRLARQTPGVFPVLAVDWPRRAETFAGAKAIVFYLDCGDKHPLRDEAKLAEVQRLADAGVGLVGCHQFVDIPKELNPAMQRLVGAAWEKGASQRGHWVSDFKTFPQHPTTRGVTPFTIDDGWLFKLRFIDGMTGITPLVRTVSPKVKAPEYDDNAIVGWACNRECATKQGMARSFVFTGCHLHKSLAEPGYRRFLTNGILWAAGAEIPSNGAPVELDAATLGSYLPPPPAGETK